VAEGIWSERKLMNTKPRKWWLAGLLSLIEPGLGQIYNGQAIKGLIFLGLPMAISLSLFFFNIFSSKIIYFLIGFAISTIVYYVIVIGDAMFTARKFKTVYILKRYNKGIVYFSVIAFVFILNTMISTYAKSNYIKAYKIPAASNEPTLLVGDFVLSDQRISARNPQRGNFIIFEFPEDPTKDFIKRVIAIGGDIVEIRDKVLLINNEPMEEDYVVHNDSRIFSANLNPRDNFGPISIPENCCFVLGDNRDESNDSRFWGVVEYSRIKGTAKTIYWSWDSKSRVVRWNRIGATVQ
jgi:signal peptidase I